MMMASQLGEPGIVAPPPGSPFEVTLLILAVTVLGGVVAFLFMFYARRMDNAAKERRELELAHAKEREHWAIERQKLDAYRLENRAEYDHKAAELMRTMYTELREAADTMRREYTANIEVVSREASEASDRLGIVLDKISTRLLGRRAQTKD